LEPPEECTLSDELAQILNGLPRGEIDLIVAGHEHRIMANLVDETVVLAAGSKGSALVRADLVVGPGGLDLNATEIYEPWILSHTSVEPGCGDIPFPRGPLNVGGHPLLPDEEAILLIEHLEEEAGSLCEEIGCAEAGMYRSGTRESPVGNFTADALLNAFPTADLAVQNSGGLRIDISQGVITREQIYEVMPFENRLLLVEMTGAAVETLLRIGSSGTHGIFQISGGRYRFDPELIEGSDLDGDGVVGEWETDRLCWVEVNGFPLDLNRLYQVVVSDFIFEGGDHAAPAFLSSRIISHGEMVRDAMMAYLQSQEGCLLDETGGGAGRSARIETGVCDVY
jgi:2',3'-cyclic-nucleotide 2'-phosphodiesterase (5'-nucleotidase family)